MLQDALGKVVDGTTSFEEVLRVIEIEDAEDFFENDVAEKLKEKEKEKDEKIKKELELQEEKQNNEKEETKTNKNELEVVTLNTIDKKENKNQEQTNQVIPKVIPTTINKDEPPQVKAANANKPINTLEKIQKIDEKNAEPTLTSKIPIKPNPILKTTNIQPEETEISQTATTSQPTEQQPEQHQTLTIPTINKKITNPVTLPTGQINNNIKPVVQPAEQLQNLQKQIKTQQQKINPQPQPQQEQEPPLPPIPLVKITPSQT